jgi:predicted membrane protein
LSIGNGKAERDSMRAEEELAIWALVEVLALWIFVIAMAVGSLHNTPTSLVVQVCQVVTGLAFLPFIALALAIRRFRIERKEKKEQ